MSRSKSKEQSEQAWSLKGFHRVCLGVLALCAILSLTMQLRLQGAIKPEANAQAKQAELADLACTTIDSLRRPLGPKGVYNPFSEPFKQLVEDCAIVAPDQVLIGAGLGPEIDAHNLVFRANEVPRDMQVQDLGRKTNVMVLHESTKGTVKFVRPPRKCSGPQCSKEVHCQGSACKFDALVLTAGWDPETALRQFGTAPGYVAQFHKSTQYVLNVMFQRNETAVSTPLFITLWTAAANCRRLTLYGLFGQHLKMSERELVKQLLGGAAVGWGQRSKKTKCFDQSLLSVHLAIGEIQSSASDAMSSAKKDVGRCRFNDMVAFNGKGTSPFQERVDDCALVTSSSFLKGSGMGPEIDKHQLIFRANRLTTPKFASDFGSRTDVIFLNCMNSRAGTVSWMGTYDGAMTNCSHGGSDCSFSAVLLRSCFDNTARWGTAAGAWGQAPFWVGVQGKNIQDTMCTMNNYRLTNPTTGLLAIWSAATMCRNLTIYGFRGTANADGHASEAKHDLETEHQFLADLSSGVVRKLNWTRRTNINQCLDESFKTFRLIDGDKIVDRRKQTWLQQARSSFRAAIKG